MGAKLNAAVTGLAWQLGYVLMPRWRWRNAGLSQHLKRLLPHLGIDLVVDVGANAGQYRNFLRNEVGYAGEILSVEPVPELVELLQQHAEEDPHWRVEGVALGAAEGSLDFHVMRDSQFSSFRTPTDGGLMTFTKNKVVRTVTVPVRTLDTLLAPVLAAGPRRIYLKLDTQGFDLEALKGAHAALPAVQALQSETCFEPIYRDMPRYHEVIEYARERGFVTSGMFANNPEHFPLMIESDCVMVRQPVS